MTLGLRGRVALKWPELKAHVEALLFTGDANHLSVWGWGKATTAVVEELRETGVVGQAFSNYNLAVPLDGRTWGDVMEIARAVYVAQRLVGHANAGS